MSISRLQLAREILADNDAEHVADLRCALRKVALSTAVERRFCQQSATSSKSPVWQLR